MTQVQHHGLTHECNDPECHVPGFITTLGMTDAYVSPAEVERLIREAKAELIAERDKAREECGHEKAMRRSIADELHNWIINETPRRIADALAARADTIAATPGREARP